jgi:hypothetical protein
MRKISIDNSSSNSNKINNNNTAYNEIKKSDTTATTRTITTAFITREKVEGQEDGSCSSRDKLQMDTQALSANSRFNRIAIISNQSRKLLFTRTIQLFDKTRIESFS